MVLFAIVNICNLSRILVFDTILFFVKYEIMKTCYHQHWQLLTETLQAMMTLHCLFYLHRFIFPDEDPLLPLASHPNHHQPAGDGAADVHLCHGHPSWSVCIRKVSESSLRPQQRVAQAKGLLEVITEPGNY